MLSIARTTIILLIFLTTLSVVFFIHHEYVVLLKEKNPLHYYSEANYGYDRHAALLRHRWFSKLGGSKNVSDQLIKGQLFLNLDWNLSDFDGYDDDDSIREKPKSTINNMTRSNSKKVLDKPTQHKASESPDENKNQIHNSNSINSQKTQNSIERNIQNRKANIIKEKLSHSRGKLLCNKRELDSEVIYWKEVPGDKEYISPIIPLSDQKRPFQKYLSFAYDHGGWNNMRMSMECIIIMAHAMGRTLVVPPYQHLYLLNKNRKGKKSGVQQKDDELGFEDFFNVDLLRQQKGLRIMPMKVFLEKEGLTGHLRGIYPPGNRTDIWGTHTLWPYLDKSADVTPEWATKAVVMPINASHYTLDNLKDYPDVVKARLETFKHKKGRDENGLVYYDENLQSVRHIHIPGDGDHRLLKHHYTFAFFGDNNQQKFYKRLVRDYIRYKDEIHCVGHDVIQAIRKDAAAHNKDGSNHFYALHIRRGDFQFKEVKLSAGEIYYNLHYSNGTAIIPDNAFVYISTDDPDGVCKDCLKERKPCEDYPRPKPVGCPEDTSWNVFLQRGWKLRFLRDYLSPADGGVSKTGGVPSLNNLNPNFHGMIEVIICTRGIAFAGTVHSSFTGYILRLRGYHGLGSSSFYHSNISLNYLHNKNERNVGSGWWREWTNGWEDDEFEITI